MAFLNDHKLSTFNLYRCYNISKLMLTSYPKSSNNTPKTKQFSGELIPLPLLNISSKQQNNVGQSADFLQLPDQYIDEDDEQSFTLLNSRRDSVPQQRQIKRSIINRSCLQVISFSYKMLRQIPSEISQQHPLLNAYLPNIQKIDLSSNHIVSIESIDFSHLTSLKELILNDNEIVDLPHDHINLCKHLKNLNLNNNRINVINAMDKLAYLQLRGNPIKLITSKLVKLPYLQFVTCDWLEYLIETHNHDGNDRIKTYLKDYQKFKHQILQKIDYSKEENDSYCDFNAYFTVRFDQYNRKYLINGSNSNMLLSALLYKAIIRSDNFFFQYLKGFHHNINFAHLTYNNKLILEIMLENDKREGLELFKLKKSNYSQMSDSKVYFESLMVACKYANYEIFKYLIHIRNKRKQILTQSQMNNLIKVTLQKFSSERESDKILKELIRYYEQINDSKIIIYLPTQYNQKLYRQLSQGIVEIYCHPHLKKKFIFEYDHLAGKEKSNMVTSPIHFSMRSRNQQLTSILLKDNYNVFQRNQNGLMCKYTPGCTQTSRKLIWKREKQVIAEKFQRNHSLQKLRVQSISYLREKQRNMTLSQEMARRIPYDYLTYSLIRYQPNREDNPSSLKDSEERQDILNNIEWELKKLNSIVLQGNKLKQMLTMNTIIFLLNKITVCKSPHQQIFQQIQNQAIIHRKLLQQYEDYQQKNNTLINYELMQAMQMLACNKSSPEMKNENFGEKKMGWGQEYWCCQNAVCE